MRFIFLTLFILLHVCTFSQQQIIYSFAESPQTLMLNPGAETNYKYHYGIPFLSNLGIDAGASSFNLNDLFLNNGVGFTDKLKNVLNDSDENDFLALNIRNDVLYGGFRLDTRTYLSFGFYQELDFIFHLPKDILELGLYGNANFINRTYELSQLKYSGNVQGVLHAGISRKVNDRFNFGGRVKIYSSSANVQSFGNSGTFRTVNSSQNIIRQTLNNIDINTRSAGLVDSNDTFLKEPRDLFTNTFLSGNLGLGVDVGFTYHFSSQLEFSASLLDLGFISFSKNTKNHSAEGNFVFDGINFEYDPDNPRDYWQELDDRFNENVDISENEDAYISFVPLRLNAALRYSFGEVRPKECYASTRKKYHYNAIGFQVHTVSRPTSSLISFTSFFENSFSDNFHIKLTHTFNKYSNTLLGAALAFQWRTLNFVGSINNLTKARSLETANTLSLNLGLNFVIN